MGLHKFYMIELSDETFFVSSDIELARFNVRSLVDNLIPDSNYYVYKHFWFILDSVLPSNIDIFRY